jgi:hypothetical protein
METKKTNFIFILLLSAFSFCYPLHKLYAQGMTPSPVPVITNITPAFGKVGDVVTINGDNFSPTPANNVVFFGGVKATVNTASLTSLQVVVPAGASSLAQVSVTRTDIQRTGLAKNYIPTFNVTFTYIAGSQYVPTVINSVVTFPHTPIAADFNGDGKIDIALNHSENGNVIILYRNISNTAYMSTTIGNLNGVRHIASGDFNNDGKMDLVAVSSTINAYTIFLRNQANTGFDVEDYNLQSQTNPLRIVGVTVNDFNGDGILDLAMTQNNANSVLVLLGSGLGTFQQEGNPITVPSGLINIRSGDLDGDGKADLVIGCYNSNIMSILYRNVNNNGFNTPSNLTVNTPRDMAIADFNNDGKADIAVAQQGTNNILVFTRNAGNTGFQSSMPIAVGLNPFGIAAGDYNGDKNIDLVVSNFNTNNTVNEHKITLLQGDNTGNFSLVSHYPVGNNPTDIVFTDVNGDGMADIVNTNYNSFSVTIHQLTVINNPPTLTDLSPLTIDEDAMQQTVNLAGITDGGEGNQTLTVTATSNNTALIPNPTITYTSPNTTGTLQFTPLPNANGTATITVNVNDGTTTTSKTFVVTVNAINDVPAFTKGSNPSVQLNAGLQTFTNWASQITDGDPEIVQTLEFVLTNDNNALFSVQPAISPTGTLTFTPAMGQIGTANLTVKLTDNGSNVAPNVNESATQTFTISVVNTNNQAPVFTKGADPTVLEDAGLQTVPNWATGIDDGDVTLVQQVTFEIVGNTNPNLFSVPPAVSETGTLTYTPSPNANGTALITLRLRDNGLGTAPNVNVSGNQSFNINVTAVNDAPTFTKGEDISVLNAQAQSFGGWAKNIDDGDPEITQVLTFEVSNDNNGLFSVQPAINLNGTLTFTPAPNANGVANVTVILKDNGSNVAPNVNQSAPQNFVIIIANGVNDAPTFSLGADLTIDENSGLQTRANFATNMDDGDPEVVQTLAFEVTNNNTNLFSVQPTMEADGSLRFEAKPNANGTAEVSVVLVDNGANNAPNVNRSVIKKFNINVTPVNVAPSFLIDRERALQNYYTAGGIQFFYYNYWYFAPLEILNYNTDGAVSREEFATQIEDGDPELTQVLTFNVSNDNNALFDVQPAIAANGRLSYTVKAGALGTANVTVTLSDNGSNVLPNRNTSFPQTFRITVRGKNIVYIDANNNGNFDNGEFPRANTLVQINDFYCVYTNAQGEYDIFFNGNYNLKAVLPDNFTSSNPPTYTGNETGWLANKNFGLVGTPSRDVSIGLYNWFARPGFDTYYSVSFQNKGTQPQSGVITITFDERLQYIATQYSNPPILRRNNTLTYRYENLQPGEWRWFSIRLKVPVREDFILGQTVIYANAKINMTQGEAILVDDVPVNNSFNHCLLIRNAYDPNDKQVIPAGNISPEFVADREFLTYTVRFQNEGTAEAIRVEVRDTLSNLLDLNTLEILGSSHPFNFLLTGNEAVWHFENINLPPKSQDEAGSIGFFTFRIKPKTTVAVGEEIINRSGIYFDFNPPIITNMVKTKVVQDMEAPQIVSLSPLNNAKDVPTNKQLFFSFNEAVKKGQGEILLLEDGKVTQKLDVSSSKVTVTNEIVFIENDNFAQDKTITVQLQQGSFTDVKKNVFAGLTNWTFNNLVRIPPVPTLRAQAGNRNVTLTWNSVFVDNKEILYEVYMYSANAPQRLVGSTSETTLRIEGLENGVTYFFRVKAINTYNGLESGFSEVYGVPQSLDDFSVKLRCSNSIKFLYFFKIVVFYQYKYLLV